MFPNPEFARLVDEERRADARRAREQARASRTTKKTEHDSLAEPLSLQFSVPPASHLTGLQDRPQVKRTGLVKWIRVWASSLKGAS